MTRYNFHLSQVPLDVPQVMRINESTLTNTTVQFLWQPVDVCENRVRGFFVGYQVRNNNQVRPINQVRLINQVK